MTITIGRFGTDITTPGISSFERSGRTLRLSGYMIATTLANAKTLRQQLLGLVDNPDEPVVPLACTDDPSLNGYYRVERATVDLTADGNDLNNFRFPWSCELERVTPDYKALIESTLIAALRTNAHSIVLGSVVAYFSTPILAIPGRLAGTFTYETRQSSGDYSFFVYDVNPAVTSVNTFSLEPDASTITNAAFYPSAALLESKWADNSNYRAVVGRACPPRVAASIYTGHDWRISNGFVRVAPAVTTGAVDAGLDLNVEHYDGSAWDTAKKYTFTIGGSATTSTYNWSQCTILRNDAAAVSIRLSVNSVANVLSLTLTLRRGSRFVECRWDSSSALVFVVARATGEAATALTGGIRATSNDASGNRFVLAGAQTTTNDLTFGQITSGSVTAYDFMIGSEVAGSSAADQATAQNQIYQFMCAQSETYRIVSR